MPTIRSVLPRADSNSQDSQSVLQHGYFIAAAVIIVALVILRIFVLRWRNQTVYDFFRIGSGSRSQSPNNPNNISGYHSAQLTPLPAAYHSDRRVCSADTDAFGRRLGAVGQDRDAKDALPAYDSLDRPPKYVEAGWSHGGLLYSMEQPAVVSSHEGEQSRVIYPNATNRTLGDTLDRQFDDTMR